MNNFQIWGILSWLATNVIDANFNFYSQIKNERKWHFPALPRKSKQEFLMKDFRLAALKCQCHVDFLYNFLSAKY
jgi:hypothetical protein